MLRKRPHAPEKAACSGLPNKSFLRNNKKITALPSRALTPFGADPKDPPSYQEHPYNPFVIVASSRGSSILAAVDLSVWRKECSKRWGESGQRAGWTQVGGRILQEPESEQQDRS